uniref:NACHT domain-containing protein n=1 Tax=Haliangium sp. TaxID=2663208 RepID=UPI003D0B5BB8
GGLVASDRDAIIDRQKPYRAWVEHTLVRPALLPGQPNRHPTLGYRETVRLPGQPFDIHVLGLDSAWLAGDDADHGKLLITDDQLYYLAHDGGKPLTGLRLALLHHPLSGLADAGDAQRLLAERVDLVLHGHLHEAEAWQFHDPQRRLYQFAAGCLYEHERYPNTCHLLTLGLDDAGRLVTGDLWVRTWSHRSRAWHDDNALYQNTGEGCLRWFGADHDDGRVGAAPALLSLSMLPAESEFFHGRKPELAELDEYWADPGKRVVSIVADGGAGKSTLVRRWLDALAGRGWDRAQAAYAWSFGSQGTRDAVGSADLFFAEALRFFGDHDEPPRTPRDRALRLVACMRARRTLLVLDGVEPLQHGPGALGGQAGRFQDPALRTLLDELSTAMNGLCIVTTRVRPTDLASQASTSAPIIELGHLSEDDGAALLADLGARGTDDERRQAVRALGGHAFTLTLLGTYIRDAKRGDLRRRSEVALLHAAEKVAGDRARRMLAAYDAWFDAENCPIERAVLRLVGLFDRPADGAAVVALRREPAISGLTEAVVGASEDDWQWACARLRRAGLIERREPSDPDGLDAHPLVRVGFGDMLHAENAEAWCGGHLRLYEHYQQVALDQPDTLVGMTPLLHAVGHGCRAGRYQEVFKEVFVRRILRYNEAYLVTKLGGYGAALGALAGFFERLWDRPAAGLTSEAQYWVVAQVGFSLRALGRLAQAYGFTEDALRNAEMGRDWKNAAVRAGNLSELALALGRTADAIKHARNAVALADRSGDLFQSVSKRTTLANALHQTGELDESRALFAEAEAMQAVHWPHEPRLHSLRGYQYCDLLLSRAASFDHTTISPVALGPNSRTKPPVQSPADNFVIEPGPPFRPPTQTAADLAFQICGEILDRSSQALEQSERDGSLLSTALDRLAMGRAYLGLWLMARVSQSHRSDTPAEGAPEAAVAHLTQARVHLDDAMIGLREAGRDDYVPGGLLVRAGLRRLCGEYAAARTDLAEVMSLAEHGPMPLHACDAHLEHARLSLALGDPEAARLHLDRAAEIVAETGYHRRDRELAELRAYLAQRP